MIAFIALASARPAAAQIKMLIESDGRAHRVVSLGQKQATAIDEGGERVRAPLRRIAFGVDDGFAEGFVEIEYETEAPKLNSLRARADRIRPTAKIDAFLTADRELEDCVLVFAFPSDGRVSTYFRSLGTLRAGKTRRVLITISGPVEGKGYAHVFSGGHEVPSTDSAPPGQTLFSQVLPESGKPLRQLLGIDAPTYALSRDGSRLARLAPAADASELTVRDTRSGELVASMPVGSSYRRDRSIFWIDADTCVVHYGDELLRVDLETLAATPLGDHLGMPFQPIPDRPEILYARRFKKVDTVAATTRLYEFAATERIDCLTGEVETETPPNQTMRRSARAWRLPDGRPALWSDYKDGAPRYFVRDGETGQWAPIDSINREPGLVFHEDPRKPTLGRRLSALGLADTPDEIYIATNHASDLVEICRYSLATGRVTKTVARNPHYDVDGIGEIASPLILDPRTRALLGLAYQTDLPRVAISDERLAAAHALIDAMYPDHTHIPTQWSDDMQIVLFRSSSDRAEAIPFLVNVPAGKVGPLAPPEERSGEGRVVLRRLPARDGDRLDAYLVYPPDDYSKPYPIVALPPESFSERATGGLDPESQFFAARGYLAVRVNHRGCDGYGKARLAAGIAGGLDGPFIDDMADVVRSLIESGDGRRGSVFIAGQRLGGYAAMMSLIEYPDLYAAGASAFGYEDIAKEFNVHDARRWPSIHGPTGIPIAEKLRKDKRYARRACPIRRAGEIAAPLLIVQDSAHFYYGIVPVRSKVHDLLRRRGAARELLPFARRGYPARLAPDELAHLLSAVERFFSRYAPPEAPEPAPASPEPQA